MIPNDQQNSWRMGGASSSKKYNNVYVTETKVLAWQSRFDLLRLSEKEIGQLYEVFVNVTEASQRNYIKARDIITYCNMDKYAFAVRMLSSFAKKGQSFAGFVFEIWDICTTDEKDLADFVFSLYDFTGEGITADEAQTMLSELYGETAFKNEKRRTELMTHLYGSATEARPVSRTQFKMFTRKQAPSLFMAFSVQKKISESIVGKPFWDAQCRKRNKMSPKDLTTIGQVRQEILTGRLTMDDEGFENTNTADEGSQTTLSDLDSSARRRTSVNKDKDKDKKSGEKKEHSSKKSKVHVHEAPPGPTKITISAGSSSTTTSSSRKNHGGLGGLGMNGSRKGSARSSFESNNQGSDNNSPAVPGEYMAYHYTPLSIHPSINTQPLSIHHSINTHPLSVDDPINPKHYQYNPLSTPLYEYTTLSTPSPINTLLYQYTTLSTPRYICITNIPDKHTQQIHLTNTTKLILCCHQAHQ